MTDMTIDIIELAKKAGLTKGYIGMSGVSIDASSIEHFAALYKRALIDSGELVPAEKVQLEREECAKVADSYNTEKFPGNQLVFQRDIGRRIASAIRARSAS